MQKLSKPLWLALPVLLAFVVLLGPWSGSTAAAPETAASGLRIPPTPSVWQVVCSLIGVLFVGAIGLMMIAKFKGISRPAGRGKAGDPLTLRQTLKLSPRHRVHVVEFDSMVLLLGECDNNLAVLNTVADPVVVRDERSVADREFEISEQGVDLLDTPPPRKPPRKPPRSLAAAKGARAGVGVHPQSGRNAVAAANLAGFKTLLRQTRKSASSS